MTTEWPPAPTVTAEPAEDTSPPLDRRASFARVALLIAASVIVNTMVGVFSGEKTRFLLKDVMQLSASDVGTLGIITAIPAYLRPFMGAASDLFPLLGFHRRTYYALSWLVMALGYLGLSALHQYHYAAIVCLIIVAGAGGNLLFVIMDAVMVAVGNLTGTVGRLQTIQQFLPLVMGLTFASYLGGYVTQHWSYHLCFLMSALFALLGTPLALLIDEKRVAAAKHAHETAEEYAARLAARQQDRARVAASLRQAAASPGLWAVVGFVFYLIITPGTNNAQFYYSRDVLHFSAQFIGNLGIFGSAGAILGILAFAAASRRLPVRAMVWGAFLMDCSIYLVSLGLRDHTTGMIVAFVSAFVGSIYNLCLLTIAARACPPGIEGTVYGLVIAAIGLAGTLGEKLGSFIYDFFGPKNPFHHYSIAHGWFFLLGFGFLFTVIAFVFIPFLPAWAKSREPLQPRAEAGAPASVSG